jgi:hypothetical protein
VWLVVNRLAHAEPATVLRMANEQEPLDASPLRGTPSWAAAEHSLARRLVWAGASDEDMRLVQRLVLVPLELELIERSVTTTLGLGEIMAAVGKALGRPRLSG